MRRILVFKETDNEWYGNYHIQNDNRMLVQVTFHGNIIPSNAPDPTPIYRVSVWGNDDIGMDFDSTHEPTVWNKFLDIIRLEKVNQDILQNMGFTYF